MKHERYRKHKSDKRQEKRWPALLRRMVVGFLCVFIIAAVALTAVYLWKLHLATASSDISVWFQGETLSITWDTSFEMDACRLFRYDEETEKYVSCGEYQNGRILMDAVEAKKEIKLCLQAVRYMEVWGHRITLLGFSRELTVNPMEITNITLQMSVNPKSKEAFINWQGDKECSYEVYFLDSYGNCQLYSETDRNAITLDFAKDLALPDRREPILVAARAVRREPDYALYSPMSEPVLITRTDLLENELSLCWEQIEARQYVFSWQECRGDWYEVQQWSDEKNQWLSKCTLDWTEELTYTTEHLPSNAQVRFRVITYDSVEERDGEELKAEPSEVAFHTGMSPLYCTIWPLVSLEIWDKPLGESILGKVPAGQALCVLEETDGYFKVSYKDYLGYIDSRFCMINLPEYMGDLCLYDITNSFSSIFRVHGYLIPEITDTVVKGYENVCLSNGDYLVPYLYPCTAKLYQAAQNAAADGYKLRIYDAFRPNEATRYLYDTVEAIIDEQVIEELEEGEESEEGEETDEAEDAGEEDVSKEDGQAKETEADKSKEGEESEGKDKSEEIENSEELAQTSKSDAVSEATQTEASNVDTVQANVPNPDAMQVGVPNIGPDGEPVEGEPLEAYDTYWSVMTDGRFRLSSFLAAVVSAHNRGIALDLTLVDANTQEELLMQSDMHDLSWYSIIAQNNENARLLAKYMKDAGYNDLSSEWWHFQDDETRNAIGLNAYLATGVSIEGWKKDDIGWRYRQKDGSYYKDETVSIDGKECVFDTEGYCVREGLEKY